MVAADQAFDSLQRLQEFEELFKNRYTESDKEYKKATQEGHRSTNVPVMTPWPPKRGRSRGGRDRNRRHDRTSHHSKDHRGSDRYPHNDTFHEPRNIASNDYTDESDKYKHSGGEPHPRIPPTQQDLSVIDQDKQKSVLDTYKDSPTRPPTESDVQAILSIASSNATTFKSANLQKERMKVKKTSTKKTKPIASTTKPMLESSSLSRIPLKSSASGQQGRGESLTASLIIKSEFATSSDQKLQRHKRRHSALEDDKTSGSESEHIDVEGEFVPVIGGPSLPLPSPPPPVIVKQPFYAASNVQSHDFSSLVVSLPLKYLSQDQGRSDGRRRQVDGPITEGKPSKAKKRKKHKKHSGDKESLETPLKLKIKVRS